MTKLSIPCYLVLLVTSLTTSFTVLSEQPQAETLVGKIYGGVHAMHIETDNERSHERSDAQTNEKTKEFMNHSTKEYWKACTID